MNLHWSKNTDEEGLKELINILFCFYVMYLNDRGNTLGNTEYNRNLKSILKANILTNETLKHNKNYIDKIKEEE